MRKTKNPELKASRVLATQPASFSEWQKAHGGVSHMIQQLTAASITGITLEQVESMYAVADIRVKKTPLLQEYIRMARWLVEGKILAFYVESETLDVLIAVQWTKTPETPITWVRVHSDTKGFAKVCYDAVETALRGDTTAEAVRGRILFGFGGTPETARTWDWTKVKAKMDPLKFQVMLNWFLATERMGV